MGWGGTPPTVETATVRHRAVTYPIVFHSLPLGSARPPAMNTCARTQTVPASTSANGAMEGRSEPGAPIEPNRTEPRRAMTATTERSLLEQSRIIAAPLNPRPQLGWWKATADNWAQVELDPKPMATIRTGLARHAAFQEERAAAQNQATTDLLDLNRSIARGELTFGEAANRYALASALRQLTEANTAQHTIAADITTAMRTTGDALITKHLAPAYAKVIANALELAPLVENITDEREAMRAADEIRTAWGRLMILATRRVLLRDMARRLRKEAIVTISHPGAFECEYEYRNPEAATGERPGVVGLVALVRTAADPALLTAAQVDELEAGRDHPVRTPPPSRVSRIIRRDGTLIGGSAA
jgi:hypothetical protein